jgi:hypothetical protein
MRAMQHCSMGLSMLQICYWLVVQVACQGVACLLLGYCYCYYKSGLNLI